MADIKDEQRKMHGDKLSHALEGSHEDAVPGDDEAHAHSYGAHLQSEGKVHLSSENIGKQGREPGADVEPPQDPGHKNKGGERG